MSTPLINRSQVRQLALDVASKRAHKFTRVGGAFLDRIEARLRTIVVQEVGMHPSKGQTLT